MCHMHGASAPGVAAKGRQRLAEQKARKVLADLGHEPAPLGNPLIALEDVARRMVAFTEVAGNLVSELKGMRYSTENGEQLRAEVAVYTKAMKDTADVLEKINRLGLDERLVAIRAHQAAAVVRVVNAALDAAGVEGERRALGRAAAAEVLRSVTVDKQEVGNWA